MARPRLPIGTYGAIWVVEVRTGMWRASTRYRFEDGKRRLVERSAPGRSPERAVAVLKAALVDPEIPLPRKELSSSTRLADLLELFLDAKRTAGKAPRTVAHYQQTIRSLIVPKLGDLRLSEVGPRRLQTFIDDVIVNSGPGAAKSCRSVLSGAFGIAVRKEAIRSNPVATLERIAQPRAQASVALPLDGVPHFLHLLRHDPEMQRLDLADLFEFMLYTGCRIGEALALRWAAVDSETRRVTFAGTVIRVTGQGARIQEHGKTAESTRTITVATPVHDLLVRRRAAVDGELVFPSMLGRLRDVENTQDDWRRNRARLGYPTMTTHALRKTCATALDVQGLSARAIAEYLGHKQPSMTQDRYMSRAAGGRQAADKLDAMCWVVDG